MPVVLRSATEADAKHVELPTRRELLGGLGGLLRPRRQRPRRRAADDRNEIASSHWRPRRRGIAARQEDDNTMDAWRYGRPSPCGIRFNPAQGRVAPSPVRR